MNARGTLRWAACRRSSMQVMVFMGVPGSRLALIAQPGLSRHLGVHLEAKGNVGPGQSLLLQRGKVFWNRCHCGGRLLWMS
jgi:hypothetical protein